MVVRRLPWHLGIVAVAVPAIAAGGSVRAAAETIDVPPGITLDDSLPLATDFRTDPSTGLAVDVQMTVSGTITLQEPGLDAKLHDAFYCYSGCETVAQENGLAFGLDRGADTEYRPITSFVRGNTSGNFVATPAYDPSHKYTFTFACDENSSIVCGKMRVIATPLANPPAGVVASGSFTLTIGDSPSGDAGCTAITGVATDRESKPIEGATVRLQLAGATVNEGATGSDGRFSLEVPPGSSGELRVVLLAESAPRFRVMFGTEVVGVTGPPADVANGGCTQDFAMASLGGGMTAVPAAAVDVPAAFDAFQSVNAAWTLARRLQSEPQRALPLHVFLHCEASSPPPGVICPAPGVHFSTVGGAQPYIAVDVASSAVSPADMANMLGHEFGHFFMWSAFGEIPHFPGNANHGGYYVNPSSADSWTEGFASFYSLMVRRLVSREPEARVVGSAGDMEAAVVPWLAGGRFEEFAVVAVLLDLADKAGESTTGGTERAVDAGSIHISRSRDMFAAVVPSDVPLGTAWRAELLDGSGGRLRTIRGTVVEFEGVRLAAAAVSDTPLLRTVRLVLRPNATTGDDDPIAGDMFDLWPAILAFRSDKPDSASAGNHLFDVEDLYRVARLLYGSDSDRNGNGVPDVDEVFTIHGFFSDTHTGVSNLAFDPGEPVGLSSHTERVIDAKILPAMVPRATPPVLPELQAYIDTGGVAATALVHVELSGAREDASFATLVSPDSEGMVALPVPPPGSGGKVSVIMLAKGYSPTPALEVDVETFWPAAERNAGRSFLSATVAMEQGDELVGDQGATLQTTGGDDGFPFWIVAAALLVALAVRTSRTTSSLAKGGGAG